jgi:hypothetical protein
MQPPDDRPWIQRFAQQHPLLLALALGAALALMAALGFFKGDSGKHEYTKTTKATEDAAAELACGHFRNIANDAGAGILSDAEFRDKMKEVYETASVSEDAEIRSNARELLAAVTQEDVNRFSTAVAGFASACSRLGQ